MPYGAVKEVFRGQRCLHKDFVLQCHSWISTATTRTWQSDAAIAIALPVLSVSLCEGTATQCALRRERQYGDTVYSAHFSDSDSDVLYLLMNVNTI